MESTGTAQWTHSTAPLFSETVRLIRRETFHSMYVGNM
jgi:hypothetical protein